jgi:regulator of sigma E protease
VGLCLILAASSGALGLLYTIVKVLFGISFVIFVHELGHFLAAKLCGVKCEKFYVGFDVPEWRLLGLRMPRRLARFQWGETEYGLGIIPLGGYVKMLGQDDNPANAEKEAARIRVAGATPADGSTAAATAREALDPRSFPAKSVPQRMLIISAGIIMNLIFAVLMAAVAYRSGVNYITCVLSGTAPGSPAWQAGMGDHYKIVQIGNGNSLNEHLRFEQDLKPKVLMAGLREKELQLSVRPPDGDALRVVLRPQRENSKVPPTIGVWFAFSTTLSGDRPVVQHMAAGNAKPPFQANDRLVAVNGKTLDRFVTNPFGDFVSRDLQDELGRQFREPILVQVERMTDPIRVPASPMKWLGFTIRMGPVVGVRPGSPAEKAGFKNGDRLTRINGQPIGDPITLPQRVFDLVGTPVVFHVLRSLEQHGSEVIVELTVTPESAPLDLAYGTNLGLNGIGLAYTVGDVVADVAPNSPAKEAGLVPETRITGVSFEAEGSHPDVEVTWPTDRLDLDSALNWITVSWQLQQLPAHVKVRLFCEIPGEQHATSKEIVLAPVDLPGMFHVERGLKFVAFEQLNVAQGWGQAMQLGTRETRDKLIEVFTVLGLLSSGRVSLDNLGGPIKIAAIAGHEASLGIPRLLLFLTFLSANLALLNALPIPVLDGGHFLFLTIEGIFRRPVSEKWQARLTIVGFLFLVGLMLYVFANDIQWLARLVG